MTSAVRGIKLPVHSLTDALRVGSHFHQHLHRHASIVIDETKQEVLSAYIIVAKLLRLS
jgi:hypothetical protein